MRLVGIDHDTDMEQTEKSEKCETSKGQFIRKKRVRAVNKLKVNHKRLKLPEGNKAEKRSAAKREFMQKKRAQAVNILKENQSTPLLSQEHKSKNVKL